MTLSDRLAEYIAACFTALWVQSHEHEEALREIAAMCHQRQWRLASWDIASGLSVVGGEVPAETDGTDPLAAIRTVSALASPESSAVLVLTNFHRFLQSPEVVQAMVRQATLGKQNRTFLVVLSPVVQIPVCWRC